MALLKMIHMKVIGKNKFIEIYTLLCKFIDITGKMQN